MGSQQEKLVEKKEKEVSTDIACASASSNDGCAIDACVSFEDMKLLEDLIHGIFAYGFEKPSSIQQQAVHPIIAGRDVIAQAQSGSGKTAAFVIGALATLEIKLQQCQVIILAPTRELVKQTFTAVQCLSDYMGIAVHVCVGGASVRGDLRILQKGVHVVVGTPGRVSDMIRRRSLRINSVKQFILDEADELLSGGFKDTIYRIFVCLPASVQTSLFSTTMTSGVLELTPRFMRDPVRILVKNDELMLEKVKHFYAVTDEKRKLSVICDLIETLTSPVAIIYCKTNRTVDWLTEQMTYRSLTVSSMHGDMDPYERDFVLKDFRYGYSSVLITTDLMARGIDVQQISIVVNFDLPRSREAYIHRCGRTGRYGRKGTTLTFLTEKELSFLRDVEEYFTIEITEVSLPINAAEIIDK